MKKSNLLKEKSRGFTLIELMVVVAIIGLLAALIGVSLSGARKKSRDARRMSDLKSIQAALELYNGDNGSFPRPGRPANESLTLSSGDARGNSSGIDWICGLSSKYVSAVPIDPVNNASYRYFYRSNSNGTEYHLYAILEQGTINESQNDGGFYADNFELFTAGLQSWGRSALTTDCTP